MSASSTLFPSGFVSKPVHVKPSSPHDYLRVDIRPKPAPLGFRTIRQNLELVQRRVGSYIIHEDDLVPVRLDQFAPDLMDLPCHEVMKRIPKEITHRGARLLAADTTLGEHLTPAWGLSPKRQTTKVIIPLPIHQPAAWFKFEVQQLLFGIWTKTFAHQNVRLRGSNKFLFFKEGSLVPTERHNAQRLWGKVVTFE